MIQIETANATTAPVASADDYLAAVNAALLGASYAAQLVSSDDAMSHQSLFGGNTNVAFKSTIQFDLASAANFGFRAGVALDFKSNARPSPASKAAAMATSKPNSSRLAATGPVSAATTVWLASCPSQHRSP